MGKASQLGDSIAGYFDLSYKPSQINFHGISVVHVRSYKMLNCR